MKREVYESVKQVNALISETYIFAIIVAVAAVMLAFIIASLIKWKPGKTDSSNVVRRIWFVIIGLFAPGYFFLYNILVVSDKISKVSLEAKFSTANIISTILIVVIYLAIGVSTMLIFRRTKWGSILG